MKLLQNQHDYLLYKKYLFILTSLVLFNKISEKFIKLNFPITITITCL